MLEFTGTLGCFPSPKLYGSCLNISEGRRSDVGNKPNITLAMGTNPKGDAT